MSDFDIFYSFLAIFGAIGIIFVGGTHSVYSSCPIDDNYMIPQSFVINDVPFVFEDGHIIHVTIPDGFIGRISIVDVTRSVSLFSMRSDQTVLYSKDLKQKEYFVDVMTGYEDKVAIEVENDKVYKSQIFRFDNDVIRLSNSTFVKYITGEKLINKVTIMPVNKGY